MSKFGRVKYLTFICSYKGNIKDMGKKQNERTEAATIVADLYKVTPRYIRMVIADINKEKYKGVKPERIRSVYKQYLSGKNKLIMSIENKIKVA